MLMEDRPVGSGGGLEGFKIQIILNKNVDKIFTCHQKYIVQKQKSKIVLS